MARQIRLAEIVIAIRATTSRLRADLTTASSLIRDWSLVAQGLGGTVTEAFQQIAGVGMRAVQMGALAVTAAFALMTFEGAKFENEMVRTFTILGKGFDLTNTIMADLTDTARILGRETLFTSTQAAQGMQILARSGFSAREVMRTIRPVLNMAIVGNLEMAESANIAVAALRSFQLSAFDAGRVANVLAVLMSRANTDIRMAGEALSYVGAVAHGAGLSIEEAAAAIGILSDAGIASSRAGTTLRRVLAQMQAPSARAKKIFDELGVTMTDTAGDLRPLVDIIEDLDTAGMSAAQAMTAFGLRGGPGMQALLNRGAGALRNLQQELEASTGAAERMAQKFRTTVIGRTRDLIASVDDLGKEFSQFYMKSLAKTIFGIRNFIVELVNVGKRSRIFKTVIEGIIKLFTPFGAKIEEVAKKFIEFIKSLKVSEVKKFFDELSERAEVWANALFRAFEAVGKLITKVFGALSIENIIRGLIASIEPLAAIFLFVGKIILNIASWTARLLRFWSILPEPVKVVFGWLFKIWAALSGILAVILPLITNIIIWKLAIVAINAGLAKVGLTIGAVLLPIFTLLGGVALSIGAAIGGWTLGNFIKESKVVQTIFGWWWIYSQGILEVLKQIVTLKWANIPDTIRKAIQQMKDLGTVLNLPTPEGEAKAKPGPFAAGTIAMVGDTLTNLGKLAEQGLISPEIYQALTQTAEYTELMASNLAKANDKLGGKIRLINEHDRKIVDITDALNKILSKSGEDDSKGNTITRGSLKYGK